ncbi:hypothetical protein [Vreelandella sp. EE27]
MSLSTSGACLDQEVLAFWQAQAVWQYAASEGIAEYTDQLSSSNGLG